MTKIWRLMNSRAVVPAMISVDRQHGGMFYGETESGDFICGYATQEEAVNEANRLIDLSELQARRMLINAEKHRLNLAASLKKYQEGLAP